MTILQQPDALSLSQNIQAFRISSDAQISFVLKQGSIEILSQRYDPSSDGFISINLRDIVHARLSYQLLDSGQVYEQQKLVSDFIAIIDSTEVTFRVIRSGVDKLADTPRNFLIQNFLTWQPAEKAVTYYSPEFLTYYAVVPCRAKLKAYFTERSDNADTADVLIAELSSDIAYTIPLQYSVVAGMLNGRQPLHYDVWIENLLGQRLSSIQRYFFDEATSINEEWVLFENSLGGLDTFRAYGTSQLNAEHTHNIAELDEESLEYRVETERKFQKNSGHLNREQSRWLLDFFPSLQKYIYTGNFIRRIVVVESNVTANLRTFPVSYTFTYKYADATPLINRDYTNVPINLLAITSPGSAPLAVPSRLAEYPRQILSEGILFPVQNPYSEQWGTTTLGMLLNHISRAFSYLQSYRGYFSTEALLKEKDPIPQRGWHAFVGEPWPGTTYEYQVGKWHNTGKAPIIGSDIFVDLLKRHIDNDTIYWEETNRVIKAKGGGGGSGGVFTITVDTDETLGIHGEVLPAKINKVKQGDSLTVTIKPKAGYIVQRVNVDKVSQGAITEYTFENVQKDHTMYVWFQTETAANPIDWLERSDLPGTYYSSLQSAFDALKVDYPEKLTRDITIACMKDSVRFKRDRNLWVAEIANWNKGSMFTLTVDGANKLTLDCGSVGGLNFDHVDNLIVKNTVFVNVANYVESGAPEEVSGVNFIGDVDSYSRNLYVTDCKINGLSTLDEKHFGRYAVIGKYTENVYVNDCYITKFNCIPLKFMDCRIVSLIKSYIDASYSYGLIGHPALCTMSNSQIFIAEDNEFTGETGEYFFYLTNVEHVFFRRNYFHDGGGEGIKISSKIPVKDFVLESNLFVHMVAQPTVAWVYHYVIFDCDAEHVSVLGNTAYINSTWWQQWFIKAQNHRIDTFDCYNNIIISAVADSVPMRGISLGAVGTINSGNNLYQVPLNSAGNPIHGFFGTDDVRGSLSSMQEKGLEIGSNLVNTDVKLLQVQNGGTLYKLLDVLAGNYPADHGHLPAIDYEYKTKAATGNTVGCYNLAGTVINESNDVTTGYTGQDISEKTSFSNAAQYTSLADGLLLIKHNTLNRSRIVKVSAVGTQHSTLMLGRYGLLQILPVLDAEGEYVSDELYDINIE